VSLASLRTGDDATVTIITSRAAAALAAVPLLVLSLAGCAQSIDSSVRSSVAESVERAQDDLWSYRADLAADPEATIAGLGIFTDSRGGAPAPADGFYAQYELIDLTTNDDGSRITMLSAGGATTGGGWTYDHRDAATCFTLFFPVAGDRIDTEAADCGDIPRLATYDEVIDFDELDVRREVTDDDHPAPICQCHSGGSCDCPGG
jgi:hypothetical protein